MLIDFFFCLRKYKVKTSITEYLDLIAVLDKQVVSADINDFYTISKAVLIKDESQFDKYDRAFAEYFKGVSQIDLFDNEIPQEWLRSQLQKILSEEEKQKIEAMGGLDKLMETLKQRLEEQQKRHQGGNKWIGTGGTSPYGADGYNPEGIRIGQNKNRNFKAVKVWEQRQYKKSC